MNRIELPFVTLVYKEPIVCIYFNKDSVVDEKGLLEIREARKKLAGNKPHPVLSVMNEFADFTPGARKIAAAPNADPSITALAVVGKWLAHRLLTDVYKQIDKPPYPTEIFATEEEAVKWLLAQKQ